MAIGSISDTEIMRLQQRAYIAFKATIVTNLDRIVPDEIKEVLALVLGTEVTDERITFATRESTLAGDLEIDSIDIVEFVLQLEEKFGIQISDEDAGKWNTLGDVIDCIK